MRHAGIGFPNGAVKNADVFALPSSDLLMLATEGRSFDMRPRFTSADSTYQLMSHAILGSQNLDVLAVISAPANLQDIVFCKFRSAVGNAQVSGLADIPSRPPFGVAIRIVVRDGAKCKMPPSRQFSFSNAVDALLIVPDTQPDVAGMEDNQALRNRLPVSQLPRDLVDGAILPVKVHVPIVAGARRPSPQPAYFGTANILPESLGGLPPDDCPAGARASDRLSIVANREDGSTNGAGALNYPTISLHRDLPLVRNRGAGPALMAQERGFLLREFYHA